ncbi:hypothetical protein KY321_01555 [Candidatus Woesearchaeota archaeon]|nr:hypothetical protein [Candidatus Woesearchaeota archaeon]
MSQTYKYKSPTREAAPSGINGSGDTNSATKNRIYQIFENTIDLDELSIPSQETSETQKQESLASLQYPLIKINDYIVNGGEIDSLTIDCTDFLPRIILKCTFVHKTFITQNMPKDGDIISIAIRNKSDVLKLIRNDYVITSVVSKKNTTEVAGPTTMTFFGSLFVPFASSSKRNLSYEGTSFEAMKDLAQKTQLGFATNEDNTEDRQVWLSAFFTSLEYIDKTTLRAYKDDTSFFDSWIDIYYNLNFVNVNKQLMSGEDEVDIGAYLHNADTEFTYGENTSQEDVIEAPKVLSNYDTFKATSSYITFWKPSNNATNVTFQVGTKINCRLFEHNANLYEEDSSEKYWSVPLEPTYDPEKVDKYILLRGRATQDHSDKGEDLTRANYPFPEILVKNTWQGVQYTISNPDADNLQWDGNHHKNYVRAKVQNTINRKELDKLNVEILVKGLNTNIIRGDKIPIVLVQKDKVENMIADKESQGLDTLDQFYSGWYYVKGFKIHFSNSKENDNSIMSNFSQTFVLSRREWPPPKAVDGIKKENQNNNE